METERKLNRTASNIAAAVEHLKDICGEDETLLCDMIEGEVDLETFVDNVTQLIGEDEGNASALADRVKMMNGRKSRLTKRAERLRILLATVVDEAIHETPKTVTTPETTVTTKRLKPGLVIDAEEDIPSQWWKRADPTLNKSGLKKHLHSRLEALESIPENCEDRPAAIKAIDDELPEVPGVSLGNGDLSIAIRRV